MKEYLLDERATGDETCVNGHRMRMDTILNVGRTSYRIVVNCIVSNKVEYRSQAAGWSRKVRM